MSLWSSLSIEALLVLVVLGLTGVILSRLARRQIYRVEVAGRSMSPTLEPGDWLLLRRGPPSANESAFGLVVAARDRYGRLLLKRIVGLPGESLRVGKAVSVNGCDLLEPYASGEVPVTSYRGVSRLGASEFFLLGDHRNASTDSRELGPIKLDSLEGVVFARYWPPHRIGLLRRPKRCWITTPAAAKH